MIVAFLERANSTNLTTLQKIKDEMEISGIGDDSFINDLIAEASDLIRSFTNREFQREQITESMDGSSRTLLLVSKRLPLKEISAIRFDGNTISTTEYKLHDEDTGTIWRSGGWSKHNPVTHALGSVVLNMPGKKLYQVDYTGGFLLPGDDISGSTTISADGTNNQFDDSASNFPLLVAGEQFTVSGFLTASINRTYTVKTRTASTIKTKESVPATETAGAGVSLAVRNLPYDIERVAKNVVKEMYLGRHRDPALSEEEIGQSRVKYSGTSNPHDFLKSSPVIKRWRLRF